MQTPRGQVTDMSISGLQIFPMSTSSLGRTSLRWPSTTLITFSPISIGLRRVLRRDCTREASKKLFVHLAVLQSTTAEPRITWEIHGKHYFLLSLPANLTLPNIEFYNNILPLDFLMLYLDFTD